VPFPAAFASLAVDRVFDAVVLLLLMFAAMLAPAFPHGATVAGRPAAQLIGGWGTAAILALLGMLYLIVFFPSRIIGLYEAFARRVAPRFEEGGRNALQAFAGGLSVLRSPRRFAEVMFWTVLHWLVNALAFWLGFKAVGLDAPYSAALFLQSLIAIGVALPAAPGFFGVFEKFAQVGLAGVYGFDETRAVSWAIGFHLLSFVPITVIGAWYFSRLGLSLSDVRSAAESGDAGPTPAV
jgi:glycosyltransferase 2 family protein